MLSNKDTVDVLNDLIEISRDGQYGFTQCAERAQSPQLQATLRQRATECESGVRELQALVTQYGGKAEDSGTVMGALHRGWVSVKDAVTADSDHRLLEECERGEDAALAKYRAASRKELPPEAAAVVQRQLTGVQRNHDQVKALRDTTRA